MFVPADQTIEAVKYQRNGNNAGIVGKSQSGECAVTDATPNYNYGCLEGSKYTLTIPAENMTESEQRTRWKCVLFGAEVYSSNVVTLQITSKI